MTVIEEITQSEDFAGLDYPIEHDHERYIVAYAFMSELDDRVSWVGYYAGYRADFALSLHDRVHEESQRALFEYLSQLGYRLDHIRPNPIVGDSDPNEYTYLYFTPDERVGGDE